MVKQSRRDAPGAYCQRGGRPDCALCRGDRSQDGDNRIQEGNSRSTADPKGPENSNSDVRGPSSTIFAKKIAVVGPALDTGRGLVAPAGQFFCPREASRARSQGSDYSVGCPEAGWGRHARHAVGEPRFFADSPGAGSKWVPGATRNRSSRVSGAPPDNLEIARAPNGSESALAANPVLPGRAHLEQAETFSSRLPRKNWSGRLDSNQRPPEPHAGAQRFR